MALENGWKVVELVSPHPEGTGGTFSSSYRVERDGTAAFLKAVDFVEALQSDDPMRELQTLTTRFNSERDLVVSCGATSMKNVVRVLDSGSVNVAAPVPNPQVSYLIFELADGDIRRMRAGVSAFESAWLLRSIKHAAQGVSQLHAAGISHQDIKPSNLLTFEAERSEKLGDLGRASQIGVEGPFDHQTFPGDGLYAPPEFFYGWVSEDWETRRKASDLFQLGSLLFFQFTGVNILGALFSRLGPTFSPPAAGGEWEGGFDEVIPYLRAVVGDLADELPSLGSDELDQKLADQLRWLCEPDPRKRGNPRNHAARFGNPYSLERFVSAFSLMSTRVDRMSRVDKRQNDAS